MSLLMKKIIFCILVPCCVLSASGVICFEQSAKSRVGVEAGTVLYRRSDSHQVPLVIQGETPIETSSSLTNSSKYVNGLKAAIFYYPVMDQRVEFRYIGLLHWKDQISKEKEFGDDSFTFPFYDAQEAFAGGYKFLDTLNTKFQDFELSWIYHHVEDEFSKMLNFGIGADISFIQLYDTFFSQFTDTTRYASAVLDPGTTNTYDISARNTLIGAGLIFTFESNLLSALKWGLRANGGIYWNHIHQASEINQGTVTDFSGHKNTYAWAGQFSIIGRWEPTRLFYVFFGYDSIFLSRVALAMDQIRQSENQSTVSCNKGFLITGFTAGLGSNF